MGKKVSYFIISKESSSKSEMNNTRGTYMFVSLSLSGRQVKGGGASIRRV